MEERKLKEADHYNKKAIESSLNSRGDFEGFEPFVLESYRFLERKTKETVKDKKVLDYGCGNGVHSWWLAESAQKVVGVDLSDKSLELAKKRINNVEFLLMDCENLSFEDNSFDVVFDGGTFSSLDIEKAFFQIARVLKPGGYLIGIETLGHNPLANFKRFLNKITGRRTEWAVGHIFKIKDLKLAKQYFKDIEVYYFHIFSCIAIPLLKMPGGKIIMKAFEKIDKIILFVLPFLKRYSFKIVFVFKNPKKSI